MANETAPHIHPDTCSNSLKQPDDPVAPATQYIGYMALQVPVPAVYGRESQSNSQIPHSSPVTSTSHPLKYGESSIQNDMFPQPYAKSRHASKYPPLDQSLSACLCAYIRGYNRSALLPPYLANPLYTTHCVYSGTQPAGARPSSRYKNLSVVQNAAVPAVPDSL
ncbi:hypothetical protein D1872_222170 [compost metagenome]